MDDHEMAELDEALLDEGPEGVIVPAANVEEAASENEEEENDQEEEEEGEDEDGEEDSDEESDGGGSSVNGTDPEEDEEADPLDKVSCTLIDKDREFTAKERLIFPVMPPGRNPFRHQVLASVEVFHRERKMFIALSDQNKNNIRINLQIIDAPPGAGKTTMVILLAMMDHNNHPESEEKHALESSFNKMELAMIRCLRDAAPVGLGFVMFTESTLVRTTLAIVPDHLVHQWAEDATALGLREGADFLAFDKWKAEIIPRMEQKLKIGEAKAPERPIHFVVVTSDIAANLGKARPSWFFRRVAFDEPEQVFMSHSNNASDDFNTNPTRAISYVLMTGSYATLTEKMCFGSKARRTRLGRWMQWMRDMHSMEGVDICDYCTVRVHEDFVKQCQVLPPVETYVYTIPENPHWDALCIHSGDDRGVLVRSKCYNSKSKLASYVDEAIHSGGTPELAKMLRLVPDIDADSVGTFEELCKAVLGKLNDKHLKLVEKMKNTAEKDEVADLKRIARNAKKTITKCESIIEAVLLNEKDAQDGNWHRYKAECLADILRRGSPIMPNDEDVAIVFTCCNAKNITKVLKERGIQIADLTRKRDDVLEVLKQAKEFPGIKGIRCLLVDPHLYGRGVNLQYASVAIFMQPKLPSLDGEKSDDNYRQMLGRVRRVRPEGSKQNETIRLVMIVNENELINDMRKFKQTLDPAMCKKWTRSQVQDTGADRFQEHDGVRQTGGASASTSGSKRKSGQKAKGSSSKGGKRAKTPSEQESI